MVSDDSLSYAVGNLRAGPSQWKRMHTTGASLATIVNVGLAYLHLLPSLVPGDTSGLGSALAIFVIELVNAVFGGLLALAMGHVGKFLLTALIYVFVGLAFWTAKYELGTR